MEYLTIEFFTIEFSPMETLGPMIESLISHQGIDRDSFPRRLLRPHAGRQRSLATVPQSARQTHCGNDWRGRRVLRRSVARLARGLGTSKKLAHGRLRRRRFTQ